MLVYCRHDLSPPENSSTTIAKFQIVRHVTSDNVYVEVKHARTYLQVAMGQIVDRKVEECGDLSLAAFFGKHCDCAAQILDTASVHGAKYS